MRIFCVAGEASGDRILAAVLGGLRARVPDLELYGVGGPLCAAQGLASLYPMQSLAVNGAGDVLRRALFLWRARMRLLRELEAFRPDLVLLADYPGMNVALARRARALGIPVHYIAPPQLWAYRNPARRLARLRRDLAGVSLQFLFPFEAEAYGARIESVAQGHFFDPPAFEPARGTRLLLCPGSRAGVMRRNLPLWLERARAFFGTLDGVDVLVPEFLADEARALCVQTAGGGARVLTDKDTSFADAGAAIAFPGTITLELFLRRIPTRVWAVLDAPTFHLGRRMLSGARLALPNRIANADLLPEWVGTAPDFRSAPPEIPAARADWSPAADGDAMLAVWTRMGSDQGIAAAVAAIAARAPTTFST